MTPVNVVEVDVVFSSSGVNAPPLSETNTSNPATPEPPASSWPDQLRVNVEMLNAGRAAIVLVGAPASMVFEID